MQHPDEQKRTNKSVDLEQRLAAYYGPRLREQPLSQASWLRLRRRLKRPARQRMHWSIKHMFNRHRSRMTRQPVPEYVRIAFNRVAYDAHVSYTSSLLHCTFKRKLRAPAVRVSPFRKQPIRLVLPVDAERSLLASGLNVLLASGIARYQQAKNALLISLLLTGFVATGAFAAFFYAHHNQVISAILIVVLGGAALLLVLDRQKRHMCHTADALVMLWIGRGRMCDGLHALASCTRSPHRRKWGEPSLAERIVRVCGTRVESGNERLTMVR